MSYDCYFCHQPLSDLGYSEMMSCFHCPEVLSECHRKKFHPQWFKVCSKDKADDRYGSIYFKDISLGVYTLRYHKSPTTITILKYGDNIPFEMLMINMIIGQNLFEIPPDELKRKLQILITFQ
jgi:hypothetical protein